MTVRILTAVWGLYAMLLLYGCSIGRSTEIKSQSLNISKSRQRKGNRV